MNLSKAIGGLDLKKRYLLLTIFLILFTTNVKASSINYDLRIDKNRHFYETITYVIEKNTNDPYLNGILNNNLYFDSDNTIKYSKQVNKTDSSYIVVLKSDYDYTMFEKSKLINSCFEDVDYSFDNYQIVFSTYGSFNCSDKADIIKIDLNSDIIVETQNADIIENNQYVWNSIDKDLYIGVRIGEENPDSRVLPPKNTEVTGTKIGDTYTGIKTYSIAKTVIIVCIVVLGMMTIYIAIKKNKQLKSR